jgi:hypothetical protein
VVGVGQRAFNGTVGYWNCLNAWLAWDHDGVVDRVLSAGMIAFVGVPGRLDARRADDRVVDAVGGEAPVVLPRIKAIVDEVYSAEPELWQSPDLAEVGRRVEVWLRARCPELSDEAVVAVRNRFTFDWK